MKACDLPAFDSLNKLKLALHCYNWEFLGVILKISPNLEDLVLDYVRKMFLHSCYVILFYHASTPRVAHFIYYFELLLGNPII